MEENRNNPLEIHRRMIQSNIAELTKKRKFIDKQLALPKPKHRFRGRDTSDVLPYAENLQTVLHTLIKEELINEEAQRLQQHDSVKDCNSCAGKSVCTTTSQFAQQKSRPQFLKVHACNDSTIFQSTSPSAVTCGMPSTSSGSCGSNSPCTAYHQFSSEKTSTTEHDMSCCDDEKQPGFKDDYIFSDFQESEIEECMDDEPKNMMLYSNGAASEVFVLSSGRWETNTELPGGVSKRKPTIDQEFEEYFSTLML